jgi:hypothetical protein
MSRSARLRAVVAGISLVVLGAVLGVTADRMFHANRSRAPSAAALHEAVLERLRAELALDDGQVRAIDSMLRHHQQTVGPWPSSPWAPTSAMALSSSVHGTLATRRRRAWLVHIPGPPIMERCISSRRITRAR